MTISAEVTKVYEMLGWMSWSQKVIKHRRKSQIQRKNPNENTQSYMHRMHFENNAYLCNMHMHSGDLAYVYASTHMHSKSSILPTVFPTIFLFKSVTLYEWARATLLGPASGPRQGSLALSSHEGTYRFVKLLSR